MILNKNIIFLLLLSLTALVDAQGGFRKKYYPQNSLVSVCGNAIETPNGNFVLIGFTYNTFNSHSFNRLTILGTDPFGNELWRKDYGNYKFEYLDGIDKNSVVKETNHFYLTLTVRDSTSKQIGVLLKIDYSGDTLWQKIYRDNGGEIMPQGITKSVDGGLLITGSYQNTITTLPLLVIKTDINGNILWKKTINKPAPNEQIGTSIKQDSASKKIITVGFQFIANVSGSDMWSNVLILDSLGNKLIQTTFNNLGGGAFSDLIQLKDYNFLSSGSWNHSDTNGTPFFQSMIVKFDINGGIIWRKIFDEKATYNRMDFVFELPNGDIIAQGRSEQSWPVKPQIFKLDKNGNLIWKRSIGSANGTYEYDMERTRSMNQTQNGGFILSTVFEQHSNPRPYSIIKIDSTACDTTEAWCTSVILGVNDRSKITGYTFEMFPNPANDVVNVKLDAPQDKKFTVKFSDVSGKALDSFILNGGVEQALKISDYTAGIYFVSFFYEGYFVETKKLVITR